MPSQTSESFGGESDTAHGCGIGRKLRSLLVPQAEIQLLTPKCRKLKQLENFFLLFNFGVCTGSMSDYKINIYKLGVLWPFTIYWHQNLHYGGGRDCSSDLTILKRMPKFRLLGKSFPKFPLGGVIAKLLVCSTVLSRWQPLLRKESSFINVGRELPRRSYNLLSSRSSVEDDYKSHVDVQR